MEATKHRSASRSPRSPLRISVIAAAIAASGLLGSISAARADETCNSPYLAKLIKGQEDFIHVWTLGVEGQGDGRDKLVTIDVNPKSKRYGRVVHKVSVAGKPRGEAHHIEVAPPTTAVVQLTKLERPQTVRWRQSSTRIECRQRRLCSRRTALVGRLRSAYNGP